MKGKMKIIILQTDHHARQSCKEVLAALELVDGKDYKIFRDIHGVEDAIATDERQLFITGSFYGCQEGVAGFVHRLRQKNSQLVCLSFSIDRLEGPFDGAIEKTGRKTPQNFAHALVGFQKGMINRSEAKYEGKPFSYERYERGIGAVVKNPELQATIRMIESL
jgi:hypothetical protein